MAENGKNKSHENLIPNQVRSGEEARERGRKGGIASGKARRRKKEFQERLKAAMEMPADPKVAATLSKTGIDVHDNYDVLVAGMLKGVMKSNPQMVDRVLRQLGYDVKERRAEELHEIEKLRAALELEKAQLELERQRLWLEAVKAQQGQLEELPDDGFIEALKGSATEDWDEEDI